MDFRDLVPSRKCVKIYKRYRSYKPYLQIDFNNRCGYCDDLDSWIGGINHYHIDHFAPKKFIELENEYENLMYACPYCNIGKSDKWPTSDPSINIYQDKGFLNPISYNYNIDFNRDEEGRIIPLSNVAQYMYIELNFYLKRHQIIWSLTKLLRILNEIEGIINSISDNEGKKNLEILHYKLLRIFYFYIKQLHFENSL